VLDKSTVGCGRWVKRVMASETGKAELYDLPCSGRCVTAVSPEMLQCASAIIRKEQHITTRQLAPSLSVQGTC
jgi:hypothetical protein